ncbi:MAG: HEPN domain-containing protein [Cyclobacteriaceae bacterium]
MRAETNNINKIVNGWIESSDRDFTAMNNLFKSKDYSWSLFVGHLVLEKLLKACYTKQFKKHAPMIHNLLRLSDLLGFDLTEMQKDKLVEITTFNVSARYDDIKIAFYEKCTKDFTKKWLDEIKNLENG